MRVQVLVLVQYLRVGLVGGAAATGAALASGAAAAAFVAALAELVHAASSLPASPTEPAGPPPSLRLAEPPAGSGCPRGPDATLGSAWQGRAGVEWAAPGALDDAPKAWQPGSGIVAGSKSASSLSSASKIAHARRTLVSLPWTITHRLSLGTSMRAPVSSRIAFTVAPFLPKTFARRCKSGSTRFR